MVASQPIHAIILSLSLSLSVWHAIFRPHDAERRPQLDKGRPLSESRRSPRQRSCLRTQAHLTTGTLASRSMARPLTGSEGPAAKALPAPLLRTIAAMCCAVLARCPRLWDCSDDAQRQAGKQAGRQAGRASVSLSLCLSVSLRFFGQSGCPQLGQLGLTSCCSARPRYSGCRSY